MTKQHSCTFAVLAAALLTGALAGCGDHPPARELTSPVTEAAPLPAALPPAPRFAQPAPVEPLTQPPPPPAISANDPPLSTMQPAAPGAKISVAVDLRYQFDGEAAQNQPVTLRLAATPRVEGSNLRIEVKETKGLRVDTVPLSVQKASPGGVYRQNLSVTRLAAVPAPLRVLVTMDTEAGMGFGYFTVPLEPGTNTHNKQDSVKQR